MLIHPHLPALKQVCTDSLIANKIKQMIKSTISFTENKIGTQFRAQLTLETAKNRQFAIILSDSAHPEKFI